jgi:hypothetical protein
VRLGATPSRSASSIRRLPRRAPPKRADAVRHCRRDRVTVARLRCHDLRLSSVHPYDPFTDANDCRTDPPSPVPLRTRAPPRGPPPPATVRARRRRHELRLDRAVPADPLTGDLDLSSGLPSSVPRRLTAPSWNAPSGPTSSLACRDLAGVAVPRHVDPLFALLAWAASPRGWSSVGGLAKCGPV